MTPFIGQALAENTLGLAPHYPLLHAVALGLEARAVFEFGAGGSTRVLLDALGEGAVLYSCSTDPADEVANRYGFRGDHPAWKHLHGLSGELLPSVAHDLPDLDLILHDGSHTGLVVSADLRAVLPKLRRFGLCLVHDTLHSGCGTEVMGAIVQVCREFPVSRLTLPYGFGLTILRCEDPGRPTIQIGRTKVGSAHRTRLVW